ncbi:MAG: hypothetical protein GDA52_08175 [Rhodobacteraceae bacterium]|nr:hypothetical protein [Paracoccaceae bacterium]
MIPLAELEGRWRLYREVADHHTGRVGWLEGEAVFATDAKGLVQTETGLLHYGTAPPMRAARRYLWRQSGTRLAVFFDDGRPFHEIDPSLQGAEHLCTPDLYRVRYDISGWPRWSSRWEVTGPRKDAVIISRYEHHTRVHPRQFKTGNL